MNLRGRSCQAVTRLDTNSKEVPLGESVMTNGSRQPLILSRAWIQGMLFTFVIGFSILGYLALRVYEDHCTGLRGC